MYPTSNVKIDIKQFAINIAMQLHNNGSIPSMIDTRSLSGEFDTKKVLEIMQQQNIMFAEPKITSTIDFILKDAKKIYNWIIE
jgi:hypothetical protein